MVRIRGTMYRPIAPSNAPQGGRGALIFELGVLGALDAGAGGQCELPAAHSQKHTDRHQNETDTPRQSQRVRWSSQKPEFVYGRMDMSCPKSTKATELPTPNCGATQVTLRI